MAFHHPTCGSQHTTTTEARDCESPNTWPCWWLVPYTDEDGPAARDCGAPARVTATGWACNAGHEHVTVEARRDQGWDYAENDGEAKALLSVGVDVVAIDGASYLWGTW